MKYTVRVNETTVTIEICRHGEHKALLVNGKPALLDFTSLIIEGNSVRFELDGRRKACSVKRVDSVYSVKIGGNDYQVAVNAESAAGVSPDRGLTEPFEEEIRSPMPGLVNTLCVKAGESIMQDDAVLILEAMKMENEIRSPVSGKIKSLHVSSGTRVEKGDLLAKIEGFSTS